MVEAILEKIVFTHISYDINVDEAQSFKLEIKNEFKLKVPKAVDDNSFLLMVETSIVEPEKKIIAIEIKADAYFECSEKPSSYEELIKTQCFSKIMDLLSKKVDGILEILGYPKLNIHPTEE